ncbi:MAG: DUF4176 domain-containing protein [Bacillota bacterium]
MTNNTTAYLPLGSVVTLIDGTKPLMIYGRKQMQTNSQNVWDYVACLYPEGNLGENYNIFFQQEEIASILFKGYVGSDEAQMLELLNSTQASSSAKAKNGGKNEKHS